MTVRGTTEKTLALLFLVVCGAAYTWDLSRANPGTAGAWIAGGAFGGFILAMVTIFKSAWSPVTAPLYAVAEGLFLGGVSAQFERNYPGLVINAVFLTSGTLASMLVLYRLGVLRATDRFRKGVFAATGAICLVYFAQMILSFFGKSIPSIFASGGIGIAFSLIVVAIAAFNFILDFDLIEQGSNYGAPRYMEWYGAFGLLVTLVWLYIEMLRLLAKLRDR
jgi:uncharacterized YccA/Bax inhibitor family protein